MPEAAGAGRPRPPPRGARGLALTLALALAHCGYHWHARPTLLALTCVDVLPFTERSPSGLAPELAAQLQRRLRADGVPQGCGGARIDGHIDLLTRRSLGREGVLSWQLVALVHASLWPAGANAPIWQADIEVSEDYLSAKGVAIQPLLTESNQRTALLRLAEVAAAHVYERLALANQVDIEPAAPAPDTSAPKTPATPPAPAPSTPAAPPTPAAPTTATMPAPKALAAPPAPAPTAGP